VVSDFLQEIDFPQQLHIFPIQQLVAVDAQQHADDGIQPRHIIDLK